MLKGPLSLAVVAGLLGMPIPICAQLVVLQEWGHLGSGPGEFNCPFFVAVGPNGEVYVTDYFNDRVQRFSADGQYLDEWGGPGSGPGLLSGPFGIGAGPDGSIYVADSGNGRIQRFDADGNYMLSWTITEPGDLSVYPLNVAVSQSGTVHVALSSGWPIEVFTSEGVALDSWPVPPDTTCDYGSGVWGLGVGPSGAVYLVDRYCKKIRKFSSTGEPILSWNAYQHSPAPTVGLWTAAIDGGERVYVTSENNTSLIVFNADGSSATEFTPMAMSSGCPIGPTGVATSTDGSVYVSYCSHDLVQRLSDGPVQAQSASWGRLKSIYR